MGRKIWLERLGPCWSNLSSAWRMTLRGIFRHRLRTLAGMFAAAMGAGLLMTGFMMVEIQSFLIDFQFHEIMRSDIDLAFESERSEAALDEIKRLPGVDWAEPMFNVACTFVHGPYRRKAGVTGLLNNARLTIPHDKQRRAITIPDTGIVLTDRLADILHAQAGDTITIVPVKGERRPVQLSVARVAESYLGIAAYADIHFLSQQVGGEFTMTGAQLATNNNTADRLELYRKLKHTPSVQSLSARQDMIDNLVKTLMNNQYVFISILVLFSGIVFFGSVVNSSMVSLAERQREVGTFRAMGYGPWEVGGLFLRENLVVNLTGTLLGLPFGYGLVQLTSLAYAQNDLIRLPVVSAPWVWIGTIALSLVFALCAHVVVQWRLNTMDYLEALKVKE